MKVQVDRGMFADFFRAYDRYNAWGYDGISDLWDFLEEDETVNGEVDLDVVALDTDYAWYRDEEDAARDLGCSDDCIESAIVWKGRGVIVASFLL